MTALELATTGIVLSAAIAILGQSIVVVNLGAGVPNFAAGAIGMVGAYSFYDLWDSDGWPWPIALVVGLAVAAAISVAMYVLVMRRLRRSSIAAKIIATLGLMTLLLALGDQYFAPEGNIKAVESFLPDQRLFHAGNVSVSTSQLWFTLAALFVTGALIVMQRRTRFGLATSAVCENETVAAGMGWSPDAIAAANWALGGVVAAVALMLLAPTSGLSPGGLTILVVPALGAALIGHFESFSWTLFGAFVIGIAESEVGYFTTAPGWAEATPLIIIVFILLIRGQARHDRSEVADRLPSVNTGRLGLGTAITVLVALLLVLLISTSWLTAVTTTMAAAIGMLSVVVLTGYAGQLSLAQFGLAGIGAFMTALLAIRLDYPLWLAIIVSIVITIPIGLIVALPALRTRGSTLAIATLALVVVIEDLILTNPTAVGWLSYKSLPPFTLGPVNASPLYYPRTYAVVVFVVLVTTGWIVCNLRRGATGRRLLAIRVNPQAASSIGISPTGMKIYAFGLAAAIAALCGGLIEAQFTYPDFSLFGTQDSITLVLQSVIGGVGWVAGAVVGGVGQQSGVLSQLIGEFVSPSNWLAILTAVGVLLVVVQSPDGIVPINIRQFKQLVSFIRRSRVGNRSRDRSHRATRGLSRRSEDPFAKALRLGQVVNQRRDPTSVHVENLSVTFGGVRALDGVNLSIAPGEIVGLIGPNGAGKSTFIDAVCGAQAPSSGVVRVDGQEVDKLSATGRAKLGMIRSFQSLELFEDMTIGENLLVASERPSGWRLLIDLVWPGNSHPTEAARLAVQDFRLESVIGETPRSLDHGRRRLVAIARAFAADPAVVFLDEPAAGLDRRQRDELGELLHKAAKEWNIGILLVEHDVGMVFRVCDRVVALVNGRVLVEGEATEVREHPLLREAYLGSQDAALPEGSTHESVTPDSFGKSSTQAIGRFR